jgi:hypothetical protein
MRLHRQQTGSTPERRFGVPAYVEIQSQLGKALRKHYEPPAELPPHLLTLLVRLNDKNNEE